MSSDDSEVWSEIKEARRQKRWKNRDSSLALLRARGFAFKEMDAPTAHYRVQGVNFWATTGTFIDPQNGFRGRGVFNLMKYLCGEMATSK